MANVIIIHDFYVCGCNEIGSVSGNFIRLAFNSGILRYAAKRLPTIVCRGPDLSLVVHSVCTEKAKKRKKRLLLYTDGYTHNSIHTCIGTPYINLHMHSRSDIVCTPIPPPLSVTCPFPSLPYPLRSSTIYAYFEPKPYL